MKILKFEDLENNPCVLYKYIRGSHAYGLNTPESDVDTAMVYLEPIEQLMGLGLDYQEQINDKTNDNVAYSLKKFMNLICESNPNMLESLFIPDRCVIYEHPIITELKKHRDKFITKRCFKAFFGYAYTQIEKARGLNKMIVNPVKERLTVLDFCYTFYKQGSTKILNWLEHRGLMQKYCGIVNIPNMYNTVGVYYDWGSHFYNEHLNAEDCWDVFIDDNDDLIELIHKLKTDKSLTEKQIEELNNKVKKCQLSNMVDFICENYCGYDYDDFIKWFNKQTVKGYNGITKEDNSSDEIRHCSVDKGEKPITYMTFNKDGYSQHCKKYKEFKEWEQKRNPVRYKSNLHKNYDAKNICHSFRLMQMAIEIAQGKGFILDRTGIDREFLLNVKNHKYEYDEVMSMLEEKKAIMEEAMKTSNIPDDIDKDFVNNLMLDIRMKQLNKEV